MNFSPHSRTRSISLTGSVPSNTTACLSIVRTQSYYQLGYYQWLSRAGPVGWYDAQIHDNYSSYFLLAHTNRSSCTTISRRPAPRPTVFETVEETEGTRIKRGARRWFSQTSNAAWYNAQIYDNSSRYRYVGRYK